MPEFKHGKKHWKLPNWKSEMSECIPTFGTIDRPGARLVSAPCPELLLSARQTFGARALHLQSRSMGNMH